MPHQNAVRARHPSSAARPPGTLALLDRLLDDHTDAGAANALNAAGHRSGEGKPFTGRIVLSRAWKDITARYLAQPYPLVYRAFGRLRRRLERVNSSPLFPYTFSGHEFDADPEPAPPGQLRSETPQAPAQMKLIVGLSGSSGVMLGVRLSADPGRRLAYPVRRAGTNEQTTIVDTVCAERQGAAVRIGEPARKHGVGDADISHAVRTAIRKIDMDDDLTMLIGPSRDGTPLEIGVLDLNGEDPVVIHAMRLRPKFHPLIRQG